MKVPHSLRSIYEAQEENANRLKKRVDELIFNKKHMKWHYISRVKTVESFALKMETGRFTNQTISDDLFACTLVVENQASIREARSFVETLFKIESQKPVNPGFTHKSPDAFPYDDLRLYVSWQDDTNLPSTGLHNTVFELQIKTFLQHAWGIATHDMIYKASSISWAKRRIAFEIKAMLEHAEVSITCADALASNPFVNKTNKGTKRLQRIMTILGASWENNRLPKDMIRLAENIDNFIHALNISIPDLREIITDETQAGRGAHLQNLSPYGTIVQAVIDKKPSSIRKFIDNESKSSFKLLVTPEITLPQEFTTSSSEKLFRVT